MRDNDRIGRLALVLSHVLSPALLATLLLLATPWRREGVSVPEAAVATLFTTVVPWAALIAARLRGQVSDLHVTRRSQRHRLFAFTASSILLGVVVLALMGAGSAMFLEVAAMLAGLVVVALINLWWKVSVHLAVGSYCALSVAAAEPAWVAGFLAVLAWTRLRSAQHTASQVCGGTLVGLAVYQAADHAVALIGG